MADTIQTGFTTGQTLYYQIRNLTAAVWSTSTFVTYADADWADYVLTMTEQTDSSWYVATFASLPAGTYAIGIWQQLGGSPAKTDLSVGSDSYYWTGTEFIDLSQISTLQSADISAAVLTTPANKLATTVSGYTTVDNTTAIGTAVWATTTRSLTTYGTLVADTTTAVWAAGTRTLSTYGTLVADSAAAVWASGTRLLTAFSFDTNNATLEADYTTARAVKLDNLDAAVSTRSDFDDATDTVTVGNPNDCKATVTALATIQAVTDKLDTSVELDGAVYRFTTNALEQAPTPSTATVAKQDTILTNIAALNDITAAEVSTDLLGTTIDGSIDFATAMKQILAGQVGKIVRTGTSPITMAFYAQDDTTVLWTWTVATDGSGRTVV